MTRSNKRKRDRSQIHVRLSADENERIRANAAGAGLTPASFMRQLALGHRPKSVIDSAHILELIRLRGDQGRVGGLLKLWLSDDPKAAGYSRLDILGLVEQLNDLQHKIRATIYKLDKSIQRRKSGGT